MNEVSPAKKLGFLPSVNYVMERAMLIAAANHLDVKVAASQVLDAIEWLNARLYPTTDEPHT